jgi:hypothetical protein
MHSQRGFRFERQGTEGRRRTCNFRQGHCTGHCRYSMPNRSCQEAERSAGNRRRKRRPVRFAESARKRSPGRRAARKGLDRGGRSARSVSLRPRWSARNSPCRSRIAPFGFRSAPCPEQKGGWHRLQTTCASLSIIASHGESRRQRWAASTSRALRARRVEALELGAIHDDARRFCPAGGESDQSPPGSRFKARLFPR